MQDEEVKKPVRKNFKIIFIILIALILGGALTAFVFTRRPEILGLSKMGGAPAQSEIDLLIAEVSTLISLPTDEKPTVATVADVEKIKNQPFFTNAKNGDRVLIYTNARKAILYRPSEKRIIEVGAIDIKNPTPSPNSTIQSPSPAAAPTATSAATPR